MDRLHTGAYFAFLAVAVIFTSEFLSAASAEISGVFTNVPEVAEEGYEVLYEVELPVRAVFRDLTPVPYTKDNTATAPDFDRVAYYLELTDDTGTDWVYVSMDAFTDDPVKLGIPHNIDNPVVHQQTVQNMTVASNVAEVVTGSFIDTGNIEMWPSNYNRENTSGVFAASDATFDWGNGGAGKSAGHGSFQIHNSLARQTLLAYNGWGTDDDFDDDIGIGPPSSGYPDWTLAENAGEYRERKLVVLIRPRTYDISFRELPRDRQLYSRDLTTGTATVPISGEESFGGFDKMILRVFREGELYLETEQALSYEQEVAAFSFEAEVVAERKKYDFELLLEKEGVRSRVEMVRDVVAGDAFLVYGQSNAEAPMYSGSANGYASEWVLTFGQNGDSGRRAENILYWVEAEGDAGRDGPGAVGQWALVLGRLLSDYYDIPVAILNGARGAASMPELQKDWEDPDALVDDEAAGRYRTYNRLRYRALEAGVAETARALFFFQGEADADDAEQHAEGFAMLREAWAADYPGLEHFYVTQVRPGCGPVTASDVALREVQRRFGDLYPNTSILASNGLRQHGDSCHFRFSRGYERHGAHHYLLVRRDLYDGPDAADIEALNPKYVEFTDGSRTELRLVLRNTGTSVDFPEGALSDFILVDPGTSATIVNRKVSGHTILFELSEPGGSESVLEYRPPLGDGPWVTHSSNAIGMLSFSESVLGTINLAADGSELTGAGLTPAADGVDSAMVTVQLRDANGNAIPRAGVEIVFSTTYGAFAGGGRVTDPIQTDEDGRASVTLTSTEAGEAEVTALVADYGEVTRGSPVTVSFGGTTGDRLAVEVNPADVDGLYTGAPFEVVVSLRDAEGNRATVSADVGVSLELAEGSFMGTLNGAGYGTIPSGESSVSIGELRYETDQSNTPEAGVVIMAADDAGSLASGESAELTFHGVDVHLALSSETISADERSAITLTATVTGDGGSLDGAAIGGVPLLFSTDSESGRFGGETTAVVTSNASGVAAIDYSPGPEAPGGTLMAELELNPTYFASEFLTILPGAPAELILSGSMRELVSGDSRDYQVEILDAYGNTTHSLPESSSVALAASGAGSVGFASPVVPEEGLAVFSVEGAQTGEVELQALLSDEGGTITSNTIEFSVIASGAARLAIAIGVEGSENPAALYAGVPFEATVTAHDFYGNRTAVSVDTPVSIAIKEASSEDAGSGVAEGVIRAGEESVRIEEIRYSKAAEDVLVLVSDDGGALDGNESEALVFHPVEVNLALTSQDDPEVVVGSAVELIVTTLAASGTPREGERFEDMEVVLTTDSESGGAFSNSLDSVTGRTDSAGELVDTYTAGLRAGVTERLRAALTVNEDLGESVSLTTLPASAVKLRLDPSSSNHTAGEPSVIHILLQDAFGNLADSESATLVKLSSDSPGIFRDEADEEEVTAVEISPGEASAGFRYLPGAAGAHRVEAAAENLEPGAVIIESSFGFADWQRWNFSDAELEDDQVSGVFADPGGFSIPNLLRYAFGMNSHSPRRDEMPRVFLSGEAGEAVLKIEYRRRVDAPDLDYLVEATSDLAGWEDLSEEQVEEVLFIGEGMELVTVRDRLPSDGKRSRYLRVRVVRKAATSGK